MKKYFVILFFLWPLLTFGQQRPQYTQYIFNNYLLNPAISGIENYADVKLGYRKQWTGIRDAPQTSFAAAHWSLGREYLWKNPLSLPERDEDPMSDNYMQNYMASPAHHGVGAVFVLDKAGPLSRMDASLTYAYHLQLGGTLNLSAGIAAGITRYGLNIDELSLEEPADPALYHAVISQYKPDLAVGLWLYGVRFFAGVSAQQLWPQQLSFTTDGLYDQGKSVPHFFGTVGYKLSIDETISATPSVMVKYVRPTSPSFDANLKVSFRDRFWLGASYRHKDSYAGLVGFNFSRLVNLTYSYDMTTSELNKVSSGSHEIVLGIQLNNGNRSARKMRMW